MNHSDRRLEIEISVFGDIGSPRAVMKVIGEFDRRQVVRFDASARAFPAALVELTVDLSATTIIDSAALGSLIRLRHALDSVGCALDVVVTQPYQVKVMRVSGLYDFLNVRESSSD